MAAAGTGRRLAVQVLPFQCTAMALSLIPTAVQEVADGQDRLLSWTPAGSGADSMTQRVPFQCSIRGKNAPFVFR
jgi:hypothetical protein